ncbi:MAG: hypothetical protein AAB890_01020 [Patescibacteria group bacterium]
MDILVYISIFSAIGIIYLLARGLILARTMDKKELSLKLASSKSIFDDFHVYVFVPFVGFLKISVLPMVFKEFEIIISKFRINVLKVERQLFHLANYIRGKREIKTDNESHPYWDSVNTLKNNKDKELK